MHRGIKLTCKFSPVFLLLLGSVVVASPQHSNSRSAYVESPCPIAMVEGARCGYLQVPENRSVAGSRLIRLAVAVLPATTAAVKPDPLVILTGGPGVPALPEYEEVIEGFAAAHRERDFIFLDQRGTGSSQPALNCDAPDEPDGSPVDLLRNCRQKLVAADGDLNGYTTPENAADVADLRSALGYESWNLWGGSYGTRLALTTMDMYPQGIRSVTIDSVFPPEVNGYADQPAATLEVLGDLVDRCAANEDCSTRYPGLERQINEIAEGLAARLDGDTEADEMGVEPFIGVVIAHLVAELAGDPVPELPGVLAEAAAGDFGALSRVAHTHEEEGDSPDPDSDSESGDGDPEGDDGPGGGESRGMFLSVTCYDEMPGADFDAARAALNPRWSGAIHEALFEQTPESIEQCSVWNVETKVRPLVPVRSDIPTLVLAGENDQATPLSWSRSAHESLGNSSIVYIEKHGAPGDAGQPVRR